MLVKIQSAAVQGIEALPVTIEVHRQNGFQFRLVGLADAAVRESQQRIRAALLNSGFRWPGFRITVNMAPADLRKVGTSYDLPLAIGILAATGQLNSDVYSQFLLAGELSLDGSIKPIKGALPIALCNDVIPKRGVILPLGNLEETAVVANTNIWGAPTLRDVVDFFDGNPDTKVVRSKPQLHLNERVDAYDFSEIQGMEHAKRAVEIAAAGGHNLLMIGPQGVGKTMIARRIPSILPAMTTEEALETTSIYSAAGMVAAGDGIQWNRPFRQPHHTSTARAILGGGLNPQPGELSLAHNGVLFLDELPEFKRSVLEVLRQPMEDRSIVLARGKYAHRFPSDCMVIASMNPSPNGQFYNPSDPNGPTPADMHRYMSRISGPLLDRIDMHLTIQDPNTSAFSEGNAETSERIRERVTIAREIQNVRFAGIPGVRINDQMSPKNLRDFGHIDRDGLTLLKTASLKLGLSLRGQHRILKVSRTIADLAQSPKIEPVHLAEAIQYRTTELGKWSM